jgi:hypothetical protein
MRSTDFPFAVMPRRFDKGGPSFTDRARQTAKGAMFAFNDEAEARARALLTGGNYDDILRDIRAQQAAYEAANPKESALFEIGGAMLPGLLPGGQGLAATRVAALAGKAPRLARIAPAIGGAVPVLGEAALYGVGAADSMADIPRSVLSEGAQALGMYGVGAAAAPRLKALGVKAVNAVGDRVLGPRVVNRMYSEKIGGPEYKPGDTLPAYGVRNIFRAAELDDIVRSGFMRPPPGGKKGQQKYFTMTDRQVPSAGNQQSLHVRVPSNRIPQGRAVRAKDVEIWDNEAGEFRKLLAVKKGR